MCNLNVNTTTTDTIPLSLIIIYDTVMALFSRNIFLIFYKDILCIGITSSTTTTAAAAIALISFIWLKVILPLLLLNYNKYPKKHHHNSISKYCLKIENKKKDSQPRVCALSQTSGLLLFQKIRNFWNSYSSFIYFIKIVIFIFFSYLPCDKSNRLHFMVPVLFRRICP